MSRDSLGTASILRPLSSRARVAQGGVLKRPGVSRVQEFKVTLSEKHIDLKALRELCFSGIPFEGGIRALCWKILLNYLPLDQTVWDSFLTKQREVYSQFLKEMIIQPGIAKANLGLNREDVTMEDHPLNPNPDSRWNNYFKDNEVLLQIDKDVRRLYPDMAFFQRATDYPCQLILDPQNDYETLRRRVEQTTLKAQTVNRNRSGVTNVSSPGKSLNLYPSNEYEVLPNGSEAHWEVVERILFIYAKLNPGIAYVQGMNEIVGPIYYTFATDPNDEWKEHAEADTFFCFTNLMSENRDNFIKSLDDSQCGITFKMESVYSMLKDRDMELYLKLQEQNIKPQYFTFRWLTLLLSQEFLLPDVIRIWDSLFSDQDRFHFLILVCCAMLVLIRDQLLAGDFTINMRLLQYDLKFKLSVVKFAEQNSGEAAARHFSVDSKRVREWRKNKSELQHLSEEDSKRARLRGGGRKNEELELQVCEWIHSMRARHLRVSRKMIRKKAKEIHATVSDSADVDVFAASAGWLDKFLQRNNLSVRRRTTVAQKDARHFTGKLVSFVTFTTRLIEKRKIQVKNIIAMDETAVWFDMVASTTVDTRGARSVPLKTTGHEKSHFTVVLAADGTKLKPYVVFKGSVREVKAMQTISGVVVASSKNGWMNEDLTADWLRKVVGKLNFGPRLLAWDSYRCHISAATKAELKRGYNVTMAVIAGGCTKYIQAPDVMWNQPFKAILHESYDNWMAGVSDKEYTTGGNMRAPARRLLVAWVLKAWDQLDAALVKNSFKVCGLTVAADGSEDHLIHCFKEGEPCASGRELLSQARQGEVVEIGEGEEEEGDDEEEFKLDYPITDVHTILAKAKELQDHS
ncbi:TBC1 domain family member 13 [Merluccius polli]|uniref:TBC1 domain family member 13 n=1 Tax=Merluccius polli TaxID=89951 RepID=A0AA47NRJ3_MERPO|nr:TBC1 domain family member 13 [Merluccius polli]